MAVKVTNEPCVCGTVIDPKEEKDVIVLNHVRFHPQCLGQVRRPDALQPIRYPKLPRRNTLPPQE